MPETLYDKLWREHLVCDLDEGLSLIYIDRHLIHEVTSPQAFAGLKQSQRQLRGVDATLAVMDHSIPTRDREHIKDPVAREQVLTLERNCASSKIRLYDMKDERQGIVHVVGPEQGFCLPGMTVVCGDSHTSTNGALGTLAFGIGTSEVEHVFATQCLPLEPWRNMRANFSGSLAPGVGAKDMILFLIGKIGTAGATGCALEYAGEAVQALSMEGRMTMCNMSIEAGARAGMVAVDETTIEYLRGKPMAPSGDLWEQAVEHWRTLRSDPGSSFEQEVEVDAAAIEPQLTWGTSPEMVAGIGAKVPDPGAEDDPVRRGGIENALRYMGLEPGTAMTDISVDKVFIGSCTNARIEDLRAAAAVVRGRKVSSAVREALVVPGSGLVRRQAEQEGLAQVFVDAGFQWRQPGCSMCLGMNDDILGSGERCASTSNRNFEGRQGQGGRTHLLSPAMAAAAAVAGHFVDVREFMGGA